MNSRVAMYLKGAITGHHLVIDLLNMIDPSNPEPILRGVPEEILDEMRKVAANYRKSEMITNFGPLPEDDQVAAARKWLETALVTERG